MLCSFDGLNSAGGMNVLLDNLPVKRSDFDVRGWALCGPFTSDSTEREPCFGVRYEDEIKGVVLFPPFPIQSVVSVNVFVVLVFVVDLHCAPVTSELAATA